MVPSPGSRVDHYEIIELIGKGGMGEVYRAKDTRLPRDVAIKTSTKVFNEQFAREARVIASLNHPNISTLYDVGSDYLVMELVEGPTLADRITQGPLSLLEASAIARQIADALEYAHEKGVVHRDLKPANIKIRPDGVVKVLDFGLAKVHGHSVTRSDESSTMAATQTPAGMMLGTAAYMSPEQATGRQVDKRADIWAFGVVFYEMLSGGRLHQGKSAQETITSVLRDEPDFGKVPAQAHRLLKHCLEKDPQQRLHHIGDVMLLLDAAPPGLHSGDTGPALAAANKSRLWPAVTAAIVVIIGVAGLAMWAPWRAETGTGQAVRFEMGPSEKMTFISGGTVAVLSPDGHWLVFPAKGEDGVTRYWLRSLDTIEARALPGTETTDIAPPASWSWDSGHVIFAADNKLQKIDTQGGPPQTLADVTRYLNGAAWNRNGVIVVGFFDGGPLVRVSASGGEAPVPVTVLEKGETHHRWPQFLPDGRHFLYQRASSDPSTMGVYIGSIDVKPEEQSRKRLLASNWQAYYAASPDGEPGNLVFLRESTLMAQPFDAVKMELSREPVVIAEGVDSVRAAMHGLFSVSEIGTLVYRKSAASRTGLTWLDEQGNRRGTFGEPGAYANPAVSPDGTQVAVTLGPEANRDIWILDVARANATRLTFDPAADDYPVWSPDGKSIVFGSDRSGRGDLYIKPADGSGEERLLFKSDEGKMSTDWCKEGYLLFHSFGPKTSEDIWALPMHGEGKAFSLLGTPFREGQGRCSPDGRWIAYASSESGAFEIYVRPFSPETGATGAKRMVSKGTGLYPRWGPDGKALFYTSLSLHQMVVDVDMSKGFQVGTPRRLFAAPGPVPDTSSRSGINDAGWDLTPDGKRFLFVAAPEGSRAIPFTVVVNWAAVLKK